MNRCFNIARWVHVVGWVAIRMLNLNIAIWLCCQSVNREYICMVYFNVNRKIIFVGRVQWHNVVMTHQHEHRTWPKWWTFNLTNKVHKRNVINYLIKVAHIWYCVRVKCNVAAIEDALTQSAITCENYQRLNTLNWQGEGRRHGHQDYTHTHSIQVHKNMRFIWI